MTLKMSMEVEIETPSAPYFVQARRQGKEAGTIPIGDLTNKQIEKIADAWKASLLEHAEKQRKEKVAA